jgi:hypothetical protein
MHSSAGVVNHLASVEWKANITQELQMQENTMVFHGIGLRSEETARQASVQFWETQQDWICPDARRKRYRVG